MPTRDSTSFILVSKEQVPNTHCLKLKPSSLRYLQDHSHVQQGAHMITQDYNSISPAYGRDYKSKAAVIDDFKSGKDFIIHPYNAPNTYCSIRDFAPNVIVNIRYNKLQRVAPYTVGEHD